MRLVLGVHGEAVCGSCTLGRMEGKRGTEASSHFALARPTNPDEHSHRRLSAQETRDHYLQMPSLSANPLFGKSCTLSGDGWSTFDSSGDGAVPFVVGRVGKDEAALAEEGPAIGGAGDMLRVEKDASASQAGRAMGGLMVEGQQVAGGAWESSEGELERSFVMPSARLTPRRTETSAGPNLLLARMLIDENRNVNWSFRRARRLFIPCCE